MPVQVNVHEAKSQLSKLIERVLNGEVVVIARSGKPVVDLVLHREPEVVIGLDEWRTFELDPALFDGVDTETNAAFYGKDWDR
jgi:antitoxin (DNA-binding transcriptional repressor) of toxin-antitoxin stability system